MDRNSLGHCEAVEPFAKSTRVALHDSDVRQFLTIGLADIEHVGRPKPSDGRRSFVRVHFGLGFAANDRSQNHDAFLAFLHEASQLIPSAKSRDVAGIRFLRSDEQNIVKAITMEAPDGLEIAGKDFAVA